MLGPDPSGRVPGVDDAVELDDAFLSGNPLAYFEARIEGLIASTTRPPDLAAEDGLAGEYLASLGIRHGDLPAVSDGDRMLQVCLDAFALRHHVAETLVRFIAAVVDSKECKDGTGCLWYHASDSPTQLTRLLDRHRAIVGRPGIDSVLTEMLLPPTARQHVADDGKLQQALGVMYGWINRAVFLLGRQDLNLNGAANKVKRGLAARARADLRVDALREPLQLVDGGIPASVLNGPSARPLFDAIAVEAIGRPESGEAFEQTVLMLRPRALLAEAHMMAVVHAAAFHVAAVAHLGERAAFVPPPYPSLPLGPMPEQVHGDETVGSRRPITFRKDGLATKRGRGLATETHFLPIADLARLGTFMVTAGESSQEADRAHRCRERSTPGAVIAPLWWPGPRAPVRRAGRTSRGPADHRGRSLGRLALGAHRLTGDGQAIAAITRITRGNFRLLERLFPQIERVLKINELHTITNDFVEAAQSTLVIGVTGSCAAIQQRQNTAIYRQRSQPSALPIPVRPARFNAR